MALFRRKRPSSGTSGPHGSGAVLFTAHRPPRNVVEQPRIDDGRTADAQSAHHDAGDDATDGGPLSATATPPPPAVSGTPVTIHHERLEELPPRLELTPSEAWHLVHEGRRPER